LDGRNTLFDRRSVVFEESDQRAQGALISPESAETLRARDDLLIRMLHERCERFGLRFGRQSDFAALAFEEAVKCGAKNGGGIFRRLVEERQEQRHFFGFLRVGEAARNFVEELCAHFGVFHAVAHEPI
jgi:hypothetical protein